MLLQFDGSRSFTVPTDNVIKIIRGTTKDKSGKYITITPKSVVDMRDAFARKFLKLYPRNCERWGVDAIEKSPVVKAQNSKQRKGNGRDIA